MLNERRTVNKKVEKIGKKRGQRRTIKAEESSALIAFVLVFLPFLAFSGPRGTRGKLPDLLDLLVDSSGVDPHSMLLGG